ncbi:amidase [Streptomyces endophyticus]|uniref:Amidase n=1 Tax=Streptomyces endophyticus TaxID=714166 RepID=A0ABU6F8C4_9ACTN|nr:amidase [Streptomyces endophyticus]MEB8340271.1 amidase [Streptomyces endophyticus]
MTDSGTIHRTTDDLAYLTATEAHALFEKREVSPVELLEAVIDRAERVEPTLNAFSHRRYDEARAQARESEARFLGKGGGAPRPLEGIPVATKEKHALAGEEMTEGSLAFKGRIATETAPVTERIQQAGGIIHARTTTPEFSIATYTHSRLWGTTRNPWNPDFTPGGSSGGSGAALAAGTATLASASDIGGSTRIPASFNNVVGFKAPYGRVPGVAPLSADFYRGDGPMARSVDDTITFQNVLAGPDPRDHTSLRPKLELPYAYEEVNGARIAMCVRLGDFEVHPEVETAVRATAQLLADAGAEVVEVELPWTTDEIVLAEMAHIGQIFGATVIETLDEHGELLNPYTHFLSEPLREANRLPFLDGLRIETRMQRELAETMAGFDALLAPVTAVPGWPAGDELTQPYAYDADSRPRDVLTRLGMTIPFNINNRCPVLTVPTGSFAAGSGLPIGVQIVGHTCDDAAVFRVGKAVEALRPWTYTALNRPAL